MKDIDIVEVNEAFAVQALYDLDRLGLKADDPRVNIWGGAIAYGHPLASSGPRLIAFMAAAFQGKSECPLRADHHVRRQGPGLFDDFGKSKNERAGRDRNMFYHPIPVTAC